MEPFSVNNDPFLMSNAPPGGLDRITQEQSRSDHDGPSYLQSICSRTGEMHNVNKWAVVIGESIGLA